MIDPIQSATTADASDTKKEYVRADVKNIPQAASTHSEMPKDRVVVTRKNQGGIELRYVPEEPKPASDKTTT